MDFFDENSSCNLRNNIHDLEKKVETILCDFPDTRNDDKLLIWSVWQTFFNLGDTMSYDDFKRLPIPESITRVRARIQNVEKKFLPTDWNVARKRRWLQEKWSELMAKDERVKE